VRSNSLGTVKINESQIRVIRLTSGSSTEKEIVNSPGQSVSPDIQKPSDVYDEQQRGYGPGHVPTE